MEPFTLIPPAPRSTPSSSPHHLFDDIVTLRSAKTADHDLQCIVALREANPGMIVTCVPSSNVSLKAFAAAGFAEMELDLETDSFASLRGYAPPKRRMGRGGLAEAVSYGKYRFRWGEEDFIVCCVDEYYQYILKEQRPGEHELGPSKATDELIVTIGDWMTSINDVVWIYDNYWTTSHALYEQVMKSSWDDVILDESMKKELTTVAKKFFSSKSVYDDLGVPWKRGLMLYGPPGNGKTVSIRALMHELYTYKDKSGNLKPIPSLYVKSASTTWDIGAVFDRARKQAPCMLILEDIETIVNKDTRSYFFNEMDGLENNDGLFVVASTNYLDRLDPGLTKRPSRFDRKYLFPLPNEHERTLYCEFWRKKLKGNDAIEFPKKLCPAMARITPKFSFAFLQECFVATLLVLAREEDEAGVWRKEEDDDDEGLDDYRLWVVFKEEAKVLRKEVENGGDGDGDGEGSEQARGSLNGMFKGLKFNSELPPAIASGGSKARNILLGQGQRQEQRGKGIPTLEQGVREGRDKFLPELPWYDQKSEYINPAAFENRL